MVLANLDRHRTGNALVDLIHEELMLRKSAGVVNLEYIGKIWYNTGYDVSTIGEKST